MGKQDVPKAHRALSQETQFGCPVNGQAEQRQNSKSSYTPRLFYGKYNSRTVGREQ